MAPFDLRSATRLISRIRQAGASLRTHARTHGTARTDGWMEGGKNTGEEEKNNVGSRKCLF